MLIVTSIAQFFQERSRRCPPCLFTVSRSCVCHLTAIRSSTDAEILHNIDALSGSMSLIVLSTVTTKDMA